VTGPMTPTTNSRKAFQELPGPLTPRKEITAGSRKLSDA